MSMDMDIKVMYLNPVGTSAYDQVFADMAGQYKYPDTTVHVTSMSGTAVSPRMTNLEYRAYEACILNETVKAARYCSVHDYDALIIGCFYDPALLAAREVAGDTVVVAPCQASVAAALNLANNFSVIIGQWKWEDQMKQAVHDYGGKDKLVSFEAVDLRVEEFHKDPQDTRARLERAAYRAVAERRAESIILGCTLEVGFFRELQAFLAARLQAFVPVIDPSIAALKAAENAALAKRIGWTNSRVWGMQPPPERELADFELFQTEVDFGNVLVVLPDGSSGLHPGPE